MKKIILILLILPVITFAQKTTIIKGFIKNSNNESIANVNITFNSSGTTSDKRGYYEIRVPIKQKVTVVFSYIGYETITKDFFAKNRSIIRYSPKLQTKAEQLKEIVVINDKRAKQNTISINTNKLQKIPGANAGVETLLMTLPGVSNNNELSTQYNVRGGNFDENLVYVNGIEVYRPFLIRSGQQEGLSFVNSNMIQNIDFSAGGFQAKYGDRLSSVLDITYRKPKDFRVSIDASLLGASATIENLKYDEKVSMILGVRYRNNSLFVNSKQTESNIQPQFTDAQTYISYEASKKLELAFLGNFSSNNYQYQPLSRRTRFGTVSDPLELIIFYEGQEKDKYSTLFGAVTADYKVNQNFNLKTTVSTFNTQEEEYFDIGASYLLGEVDTNAGAESFGEVEYTSGIGSQLNHSRNDLDALITNIEVKATIKDDENKYDFGIKYQNENFKDRIREWEFIDSLGFSVRPPNSNIINEQPYLAFTGPITPYQNIRTENNFIINRFSGFAQFSRRIFLKNTQVWLNAGVRLQNWTVRLDNDSLSKVNQTIVSPRIQLSLKPKWEKDILFRFSTGIYSQPPFYKDLRDYNGNINPNVKAQKSFHLVGGMDYSFTLWDRTFKLITDVYFKDLTDVNAYTVDNVRIRYRADNITEAYAYGVDVRLNGEFVPGNDSWISLGYLKTEENINNQGYIARPTDQRVKVGILFQDYVPNIPNIKAYLNLVYNTGVPGGSPAYANPYDFQNRLRDYKRADLGLLYVFVDAKRQYTKGFLSKFRELSAGIELFNMFDIQNSITNTWVRDIATKNQYAVPNYLSGRVINFRLSMKF